MTRSLRTRLWLYGARWRLLCHLAEGWSAFWGVQTAAEHAGRVNSLRALKRKVLVYSNPWRLSKAGEAVCIRLGIRVRPWVYGKPRDWFLPEGGGE